MSVKTTGAEFKRFYTDETFWPQDECGTWHEDESVLVDGQIFEDDYVLTPNDAKVVIDGGFMHGPQWDGENNPSFETYFKRWKKQQSTVSFTVDAPKEKLEEIKAAIRAAGGKPQ